MKGFWGIAEKVKNAGKNLSELALEPTEDTAKHEKENTLLKEEIARLNSQVKEQSGIIEKQKNYIKKLNTSGEDRAGLIDFKIVIGLEDSARALEMLEASESQLRQLESKNESIFADFLKLKEEKNVLQDSLNFEKANLERTKKKLSTLQEDLKEKEANLSYSHENYLVLKKNLKSDIEKTYQLLKKSFVAVGVQVPSNVQVDRLGNEDIQEFLQVQTNQITDIANKLSAELKGKFGVQEIKNLTEVKSAVSVVLEESTNKVMEFKEIAIAAEKTLQNSQRELNETLKRFSELQAGQEGLKKKLTEIQDENLSQKERLIEMDRVQLENEQIKAICKKMNEETREKQRKFEEDSKKFAKTYDYVSTIEDEIAELKAKLREKTSVLEEKERTLTEVKKEKDSLFAQLNDLKVYSNNELASVKHYYEGIVKKVNEEIGSEKKAVTEKLAAQIRGLEDKLKVLQKDSDDLAVARLKISEHDKGILEFHRVLNEMQDRLASSQQRNDELNEEKERLNSALAEKEGKIKAILEAEQKKREQVEKDLRSHEEKVLNIEEKLREAERMKNEANELYQHIQEKIENEDNWIDRRMVSTFLVNFLNENNTEKMKTQMLRPFAEMLGLSHEQKLRIGLEQEPGLLAQFTTFLTRG